MLLSDVSNKSLNKLLKLEKRKKFGLTNIKKFLAINHPEKSLRTIHVAGTNGKGSVCSMISQSLIEAGYKVGLYTSPHLINFNERIRINNIPISNKDIKRLAIKIHSQEKKHNLNLTFFETATVMAYYYFQEKKVDYAILETGLGGRLDATNTTNPILSIITNVSLDHQEYLGNTLEKITKEKAAIIKPNTTVITNAKGTPLNIIKQTCKKNNSKLILPKHLNIIPKKFKGTYQIENAATAAAALQELNIEKKFILQGIQKSNWPCRFQKHNNILLDCAHNEEGIKALIESLKQIKYNNLIVIFNIMQDKDNEICKLIAKLKAKFILTKSNVERAKDPIDLKKYFLNPIIIPDLNLALNYAKNQAKKNDLILITGSIYLVGEAYSLSHQTPK